MSVSCIPSQAVALLENRGKLPVDLPQPLAGLVVRNVFRDSKGRLWIGTDGQGIARIDGSTVVTFTMKDGLVNDFVRAFCEDRKGGVWIGTDGGLSYWRDGTFSSFTPATGLIYGSIRALQLDDDDSVWVATERGLARLRSGTFVQDPLLERLRGTKVWALHKDSERGLWIGTQGAGLFLLKSGRLEQFTVEHGLPSNKIHFVGAEQSGVARVPEYAHEPRGRAAALPEGSELRVHRPAQRFRAELRSMVRSRAGAIRYICRVL